MSQFLKTLQYISKDRILSYISNYIKTHKKKWTYKSKVVYKTEDSLILIFGQPHLAFFIEIGGNPHHNFKEDKEYIQSSNTSSKIGIICAFNLANSIQHGLFVFSTKEKINNGNIDYLSTYIRNKYKINKCIIIDAIKCSSKLILKNGPIFSIQKKLPPSNDFLNIFSNILGSTQLTIRDDVQIIHYSPIFFEICFFSLPFLKKNEGEIIYKKNIFLMLELCQRTVLHFQNIEN